MSRFNASLALVIVALVALAIGGAVRTEAQAAKKPAVIAVVDVQHVFKGLAEREAIEADIVQQTERVQKEATEKAQMIQEKEADLKLLAADDAAFKQKREELERIVIEFRVWQEFKKRSLEQEKVIRIEQLYNKIVEAITRTAKRDGYDLVLYKDSTEKIDPQNQQQIAAIIQSRRVLYSTPGMDLSDPVLQLLNNEWANRKKP